MIQNNKKKYYEISAFLIFIGYVFIYSMLSIKKYYAFNCSLDLANILQSFYNTCRGYFFEFTLNGRNLNVCRFSGHTELVYVLLLPLFCLFKNAQTLLVMQSIAIGLGGIGVYYLSLNLLKDKKVSFILSFSYYFFPFLANINLSDFHADPFMIFPQIMAYYFFKTKKQKLFWIFVFLATLCKEYMCVYNMLLGLFIIKDDNKKGLILILLSIFQYFVMTPLIQYACGANSISLTKESHALYIPDKHTGRSIFDVIYFFKNKLFSSNTVIKLLIVNIILFPAYKIKKTLILVFPILLALLFVGKHSLFTNHRHAMIIAPIFIAIIEGLSKYKNKNRAATFILTFSIIVFFVYPQNIIAKNLSEMFINKKYRNVYHYKYTFHDKIADSLISLIPSNLSVASNQNIRTKIANRRYSFQHPYPADIKDAEYYIFDFLEALDYTDYRLKNKRCRQLFLSDSFSVTANMDGILIFKKMKRNKRLFGLMKYDSIYSEKILNNESFKIIGQNIEKIKKGYILNTIFYKGNGLRNGDAIITTISISNNIKINVINMYSYLVHNLNELQEGFYKETTFFQIPENHIVKKISQTSLYKKDSYLPFLARPYFCQQKF